MTNLNKQLFHDMLSITHEIYFSGDKVCIYFDTKSNLTTPYTVESFIVDKTYNTKIITGVHLFEVEKKIVIIVNEQFFYSFCQKIKSIDFDKSILSPNQLIRHILIELITSSN